MHARTNTTHMSDYRNEMYEVCVQLFIAVISHTRGSALQIGCERHDNNLCNYIVRFHNGGNALQIRCERVIAWVTNCDWVDGKCEPMAC